MTNDRVSYKDYKSTYLNFASDFCIDGPLSVETVNTLVFCLNKDFVDSETLIKISNVEYIKENEISQEYISKAIEEVKNFNINSISSGDKMIKLSDAIILDNQKNEVMDLELLLDRIKELPQSEALQSYESLKYMIENNELKSLTYNQKKLIESINIPVANNLYDYRNNVKQKINVKKEV